jgi:hypothetical protein
MTMSATLSQSQIAALGHGFMDALMVLRQHVLTALALGAYRDSELGLAATLWPQLPDASLVIHPDRRGRSGLKPGRDSITENACTALVF